MPIVVTIPEGYLPYDLSRADQSRYACTRSRFRNSIMCARRPGPDHAGQGPLDCLGHGVLWNEELLPSQSVSIAANAKQESASVTWNAIRERLAGQWRAPRRRSTPNAAPWRGQSRSAPARQPASSGRRSAPRRPRCGSALVTAYAAADGRLHEATAAVAAAWPARTGPAGGEVAEPAAGEQLLARAEVDVDAANEIAEPAAGEQLLARAEVDVDAANEIAESAAAEGLLVRAGVEANAGNETAAGVAADVAESVCCPVERLEVEVQLPATHHVAAVGIAPPTLELPQVGQPHAMESLGLKRSRPPAIPQRRRSSAGQQRSGEQATRSSAWHGGRWRADRSCAERPDGRRVCRDYGRNRRTHMPAVKKLTTRWS